MSKRHIRSIRALGICGLIALCAPSSFAAPAGNRYVRRNLVSDSELRAESADQNLVNGWGLAASPSGPWWVNAADAGQSLVYNGEGGKLPLAVAIPGNPTGIVFDGGSRFAIPGGGSAAFIFASEDGTISAWSSDLAANSPAVVMVDNSGEGAIYKGLAIDSTTDGNRIYAADFFHARVDVFDGSFHPIVVEGAFTEAGDEPALAQGAGLAFLDALIAGNAPEEAVVALLGEEAARVGDQDHRVTLPDGLEAHVVVVAAVGEAEVGHWEVLEQLAREFVTGPAALFHEFLKTGKRGFVQERRISRKAMLKIAEPGADDIAEEKREAA